MFIPHSKSLFYAAVKIFHTYICWMRGMATFHAFCDQLTNWLHCLYSAINFDRFRKIVSRFCLIELNIINPLGNVGFGCEVILVLFVQQIVLLYNIYVTNHVLLVSLYLKQSAYISLRDVVQCISILWCRPHIWSILFFRIWCIHSVLKPQITRKKMFHFRKINWMRRWPLISHVNTQTHTNDAWIYAKNVWCWMFCEWMSFFTCESLAVWN